MDPFTAIGLAGNILTFIDIGFRLVSQTKGIYDSKSNSTAQNDSLSVMTTRFTTTMADMQSKIPSGNLSNDEMALKELVTECSSISDELQNLLADLKAKKPNSIRSSMKATLRDWSKKKEKDDLHKRLESSRQQLDLLLSTMTRFESLERLNQLLEYGQSNEAEITSLHRNIDALRSGLQVKFLSPEALEQVREVVSLSDRATLKVRESCILTALRFDLMDERYDDVAEAHDKTFEWIFDPSNCDGDDRLLHSSDITSYRPMERSGARDKFVDWIKHGNGIFHISGKPGSGKSTLMKYLCRREETKRHLDTWAADKFLVFGKFFFWNPGTTLQKSLRGLIRGLLYSILSNAPELIPLAFPKHWDATLSKIIVTFDSSDDIILAFTDLICRDEVYRNHKLVFFIDGLDEFQGDHAALIKELLRWTSTRPTGVKICVSSREWPIFQEAFKTFPSFRLHELTRSDVSQIVRDRLKNNDTYQKLAAPGELAHFESNLVDRSDGVFLWLKLILQDIEDGLLSGDRLSQLQNKVKALPTELNDLFQHLLNSIHPCDRKEAYLILSVALECPPDWPIFRISFLENYIENRDFVLSQLIEQLEDDQITDRLERTRKKIYGKCKGLLEIQLVHLDQERQIDQTLKESVKFTHRSIVEFLKSDQTKQKLAAGLEGLDMLDAMCQTFLAHVQAAVMDEHYYHEPDKESNLENRLDLCPEGLFNVLHPPSLDYDICTLLRANAAKDAAADSARFTAFLDTVVEVAKDLFSPQASFQLVDVNWMRSSDLIYHTIQVSFSVKVGIFAAFYGMIDYAPHTHLIGLDGVQGLVTLPMLVPAICQGAQSSPVARTRISRGLNTILNTYLELGFDPNGPSTAESMSCWHYMLMRSIVAEDRGPYVSIIASFLLHGANPRFWMRFGAKHRLKGDGDRSPVVIPIEFELGEERHRLNYPDEDSVVTVELNWPLRMFLRRGQVDLSCKELLGMMFPQQKTDFQEAIDFILHWDTDALTNNHLRELKERFQPTLDYTDIKEEQEELHTNPRCEPHNVLALLIIVFSTSLILILRPWPLKRLIIPRS
ncbi:small s [Fusarium agapanthi]|uniref:Small s n=1 Tax=Fusarium agapanthi TaxID=1803897 RepID=A0A9P5EFP6_9HYPO|nr:small s [Fusarium agapanthi]